MGDDEIDGAAVVAAHQELVSRVEKSATRMRILSLVTVLAAVFLVLSYASQLLLPFSGTTAVTVRLDDPGVVAGELVILALVLVWLWVGVSDYMFASRMRREIRNARLKEAEIAERVSSPTRDD